MDIIANAPMYFFLFLALYFEVFLMLTFFENSSDILSAPEQNKKINLAIFPTVTIIVPCWNEQNTIQKTANSLLELQYPIDKIKIMLIDDGSTDNTWNVMQQFKQHPQIEIYTKPNGGKHTALNFALERTTSEFV